MSSRFLQGGEAEITAAFPAGVVGSTLENLKAAAAGELYETTKMYPDFVEIAKQEGFKEIAAVFNCIGRAELRHKERYEALVRNIEKGIVFKREKPCDGYAGTAAMFMRDRSRRKCVRHVRIRRHTMKLKRRISKYLIDILYGRLRIG